MRSLPARREGAQIKRLDFAVVPLLLLTEDIAGI
jgi:hypothetical protein